MRVAVVVSGSRGDLQPMLALAAGLGAAGHDVIVCSSPDNESWARIVGCAFEPLGEALHDNPSLGDWGIRPFSGFIRRQMAIQVRELPRMATGRDLVVASGLAFGARSVAQHMGIAYRYISFVAAGFLGTSRDPLGIRLVRGGLEAFADLAYGSALNRERARLGLPHVRHVMRHVMGPIPIAATDPDLTVLPQGARLRSKQTGYPVLVHGGELSEHLRRFLDDGPPPLYAGFGSMPYGNRERVGRLLVEAAERTGQRIVIARGWAGIPDVGGKATSLFIGEEPHDLLFPRVRAVIHHGGAGTVATAARAGVPQLVLPQAADQFLWRSQVAKLGLGPRAPMFRLASAASLARAITAVVEDASWRQRAVEMAERLAAAPDGVGATVAELTAGAD
jgi:UDP:flavonoid glycosyltransferase YjiC (YdhE family)